MQTGFVANSKMMIDCGTVESRNSKCRYKRTKFIWGTNKECRYAQIYVIDYAVIGKFDCTKKIGILMGSREMRRYKQIDVIYDVVI